MRNVRAHRRRLRRLNEKPQQTERYDRRIRYETRRDHLHPARPRHYLFSQPFRPSLWSRYRFGVLLDEALDWSKCRGLPAEDKVREKLFKSIPYIEKEYGIALLRRSKKASRRVRREMDEIAA